MLQLSDAFTRRLCAPACCPAALLVCFRNWMYLVCVCYKVARRLALLAFHGPLDRLNGTLLTFLGMFLGLWQSMGYSVLDMAIEVALVKLQVGLLGPGLGEGCYKIRVGISQTKNPSHHPGAGSGSSEQQ